MILREVLAAALALPLRRPGMDLPPGLESMRRLRPERSAAVLIPIIQHADGPTVLLTRRTEHLDEHAGQVCFPGGRIERDDGGAVEAALRESTEEIGLSSGQVEIVGRLGEYRTISNYIVTPVVGLVQPGFVPRPDAAEVAAVFEVSMSVLRDPARRERRSHSAFGTDVAYWAYEVDGHLVWGATAAMLVELCERLDAVSPSG